MVHLAATGEAHLPRSGKLGACRLAASAHLFNVLVQVDRSDPRNIEAGNITPENAEKKVSVGVVQCMRQDLA